MNKFEVVKYVIELVALNELEKARALIQEKQLELKQEKVRGLRQEISEIIKTINRIDMELMQFKIKKIQLARLCPESLIQSLDNYMADLQQQRKQLALQKSRMAKLHSK